MRLASLIALLLLGGCAASPPRSTFYGDPLPGTTKPCLQFVTTACAK